MKEKGLSSLNDKESKHKQIENKKEDIFEEMYYIST